MGVRAHQVGIPYLEATPSVSKDDTSSDCRPLFLETVTSGWAVSPRPCLPALRSLYLYTEGLSNAVQYVQYMQGERLRKPTVSLRLSTALLQEIDALSTKTGARTRTEFIERALTDYVEEIRESKVIVVRPWTNAKARTAVLRFLKDRPSAYVSEIMEALGMDPDLAFRIVDDLAKEGRIE